MTFAVTSKGFYKEKKVTPIEKGVTVEYIWTDKLREAKQFSSRGKVNQWLKANGMEGFAYNPNEHEVIREMYRVIKRRTGFDYRDESIQEWVIEKAIMQHNSDVAFLNGKDSLAGLYTKDEAIRICLDKNISLMKELVSIINKTKELTKADGEVE